jgi:uncharacterized membrane protein
LSSRSHAVAAPPDQRAYRLGTIDMLRGLAVVIMALDHVRDFLSFGSEQDPMSNPHVTPVVFATRWITHFCAPVFVLLAGTSAGLMTVRKSRAALGAFLAKRGLWLVLVECVVISSAFTFAPLGIAELQGRTLVILQVIWAIGASMIALAGAQWFGRRACTLLGAVILLGHNLLDASWPANHMLAMGQPLWVALHAQMSYPAGPFQLLFGYPLLPWIGVMLLGFGTAGIFELPPPQRNATLRRIGLVLMGGFVLLRALDVYGDPHAWHVQESGLAATVMSFLNTTKYPPSLQFLLMTLGPAAILCSCADRLHGALKDTLVMFGRVPFAFYVVHFYLIHLLSLLLGVAQGYAPRQFLTLFIFFPKGFGLGLGGVYLAWLLVVALLYPLCRWMAGVKARRSDWWLSYL